MVAIKRVMVLLPLLLLLGCAYNDVTNLTASAQPRNEKNLYPIELVWDTNMRSIRAESLKPYVVIGFDAYEMRPTLGMNNRWEAYVPVPKDKDSIAYHFKVDYKYSRVGQPPGEGSKLSRNHILRIVEQ